MGRGVAPLPHKVTFVFEGPDWGWSESVYNLSDTFSTVLTRAVDLANVRRTFLSSTFKISFIRILKVGAPRGVRVSGGPYVGTGNATNYGSTWPFEAVMVRLDTTTEGVSGRIFLSPAPRNPASAFPDPTA